MMSFFFSKQKTAYELRISDWSSDVCSSDLGLTEDPALLDVQIGEDNALTVGGEIIGHVTGLRFRPVGHDSTDQRRIIRQAAIRVLGPALQERAATILQLPDTAFSLSPEGGVMLTGPEKDSVALAILAKGPDVQIGRASGRGRRCRSGLYLGVPGI